MPGATPAKTACFLEHHADREARLLITVNWDFGAPVTQEGCQCRVFVGMCSSHPEHMPPVLADAQRPPWRGARAIPPLSVIAIKRGHGGEWGHP